MMKERERERKKEREREREREREKEREKERVFLRLKKRSLMVFISAGPRIDDDRPFIVLAETKPIQDEVEAWPAFAFTDTACA